MNRKVKKLSVALAVMLIFSCITVNIFAADESGASQTIVVSASGDYSGVTSPAGQYTSIGQAIENAPDGSTIVVKEGTYYETLSFEGKNNLTLKAFDGQQVILSGSAVSKNEDRVIVDIEDANGIILEGLYVKDMVTTSSETAIGIYVHGASSNITIRNCDISNVVADYTKVSAKKANAHGILVCGDSKTAISNLKILNNRVHDLKLGNSESVAINGNVDGFEVIGNEVYANDNIGIDMIGYEGKKSLGELDRARNGVVSNNYVHDISVIGNPAYKSPCSDGIYVDGGKNIVIKDNVIVNCEIGIETASEAAGKYTESIEVVNNLIYGCEGYSSIVMGGSSKTKNGGAINIKIHNNTVYNKSGYNFVIQSADSNTNEIYQNIFISEAKGKNVESDKSKHNNQVYNNICSAANVMNEYPNNIYAPVYVVTYNGPAAGIQLSSEVSLVGYGYASQAQEQTPDLPGKEQTPDAPVVEQPQEPVVQNVITVDGTISDWAAIPSVGSTENITSVRTHADDQYVYFCVTANAFDKNFQIMINKDQNEETGFSKNGFDFMVENGRLYRSLGRDWSWEALDGSAIVVVRNDQVIEVSIAKSVLAELGSNYDFRFNELNASYQVSGFVEGSF